MLADAKAAAGLVSQAVASLRRLAGTPQLDNNLAEIADDLARTWERRPFIAAVVGSDTHARLSFLNTLIGSALLDPARPRPAEQLLRLCPTTRTACTAHHRDGTVEEFAPGDADPAVTELANTKGERIADGLSDVQSRNAQLELRRMDLPSVLRERPPRWALWLWLWRWILGFFYARQQEAISDAEAEVEASRSQLRSAKQDVEPAAPRDFAQRLRGLMDAASRGAKIERITLCVAGSRLPDDVAVEDVPSVSFERVRDRVDAWFWVGNAATEASADAVPSGLRRIYVVGSVNSPFDTNTVQFRRAGDLAHAADSLPRLLSVERALHIAHRASQELRRAAASLDDNLRQHEAKFSERIESLASRRIPEPKEFVNAQLERIHPRVVAQVHRLLQKECEYAKQRLDALSTAWSEQITVAESSEGIRDALAKIEEQAPSEIQAASADILGRVRDGLAQSVANLHDDALTELRKLSPLAENAVPLVPSPPNIGLSIALRPPDSLGPAPGRIARLFKSKKKLRAEICSRIQERAGRLRDVTVSDLLDTEPVIGGLLTEFVKTSVSSAVRDHDRWLSNALVDERESIERERTALAPLTQMRDVAWADADRVDNLATQAEAVLPPTIAPS